MARALELFDTDTFLAACEPAAAPVVTIESFVAAVNEVNRKHLAEDYPTLYAMGYWKPVTMERGPKYTRVVQNAGAGRSVLMFIENATGDIYKAAGWKAPAKGARGNIQTTTPKAGTSWLYR